MSIIRVGVQVIIIIIIVKIATTSASALMVYQTLQHTRTVFMEEETSDDILINQTQKLSHHLAWFVGEMGVLVPLVSPINAGMACLAGNMLDLSYDMTFILRHTAHLMPAIHELYHQREHSLQQGFIPVASIAQRWQNLTPTTIIRMQNITREWRKKELCDSFTFNRQETFIHEIAYSVIVASDIFVHIPWDEALAQNQRWLIALNNSDELRATGGFTTAYAELFIDANSHLHVHVGNAYEVDNKSLNVHRPLAPPPMLRYMEHMIWWFRDANWSPDYPESAQDTIRLYMLDQQVDNVVGLVTINLSGVPKLFSFLPDVTLNEEVINEQNILQVIRNAWGRDFELASDDPSRKDFLFELAQDLGAEFLTTLQLADFRYFGKAVTTLLDERDVMIYSDIPAIQAYAEYHRWAGRLLDATGDYLMVVDTNMGYNKVSPYVKRDVFYTVDLRTSPPQATLTLIYENTVHRPDIDCTRFVVPIDPSHLTYEYRSYSCSWNYARVMKPEGTTIIETQLQPIAGTYFEFTQFENIPPVLDTFRHGHYTGFGAMTLTGANDNTTSLTFRFELPENLLEAEANNTIYRLFVQKQAGLQTNPTYHLQVILPPNTAILDTSVPFVYEPDAHHLTYTTSLVDDLDMTLIYGVANP